MRRYLILAVLFLLSLPIQLSILGCGQNPNNFCNTFGQGFGTRRGTLVNIDLEPQQTGISLSYGQIGQLQAPTGRDCAGTTVPVGTPLYGTTDTTNQFSDISPNGAVCAGRWNRTTNGGVPAYTTCLPTNVSGVASITATAGGVSSNVVPVFIHPVVTNVSLDTTNQANGANISDGTSCLSQFQTAQLNASAFVTDNTGSHLYCAPVPNAQGVPDCGTVLGHLSYAAQTTGSNSGSSATNAVVSIDQNGVATARQPGSALITASISGTSSSAGVFYTCPPKTITLSANGGTSVNVLPNTPQPITATVIDTNGNTITGVPLSYTSTDPRTITATANGITSTFPGSSSVYAVCQPGACNPSPINRIGVNGNGTPIASNTINVTSPGNASSLLWLASPLSQYFVALDLSQSTVGTPIRLPYVPNSMVLDPSPAATSLYFGSYRELMVFSAANNTLIQEDTTVPGVVLAVSPTNGEVLINDQDRQIFYVYAPARAGSKTSGGNGSAGSTGTPASIVTQYGGVGQRATFSPDGSTIYIVGTNKLYVYNTFTGWSTEALDPTNGTAVTNCPANPSSSGTGLNASYNIFCSPDLALAVPQFGAFISGQNTTARSYCPDTRLTPIDNYPSAVPNGAIGYGFGADHLASTTDGRHLISAGINPTVNGSVSPTPLLIDSDVVVPTNVPPNPPGTPPSGACPTTQVTNNGVTTTVSLPAPIADAGDNPQSLAAFNPSVIHQVVTSPNSSLAVVTYESANPAPGNAQLPVYKVPASGPGVLTAAALKGPQATTPVAAIFSPDYQQIFVSTGGDSQIHIVSSSTLQDTAQFSTALPDGSSGITPAQFLAVKPRAIP